MSTVAISAALEARLATVTPALQLAYANEEFSPVAGTPYMQASTIFAAPNNDEFGPSFQERGLFDVLLFYPVGEGWGAALAQAELVRTAFARGTSLTGADGKIVRVVGTPAIAPAYRDGDRWVQPIRVTFNVNV